MPLIPISFLLTHPTSKDLADLITIPGPAGFQYF